MMDDSIIAITLGGITLLTPIVFILTKHQQKMASILNPASAAPLREKSDAEISALRQLVHEQSIAIDNLARSHEKLLGEIKSKNELPERIGSSG